MAKKTCFVKVKAVLEFEDEEQAASIGSAIGIAISTIAKEQKVEGCVVVVDLMRQAPDENAPSATSKPSRDAN